ncbi:uncharacterized protein LOC119666786 [Teleopsis dalmanni]|uniref:uncharacterized protein LOC119666786 n=1 Tax=Teleopsis dalmanni TaxID=139649 RepID=UPI0018CE7B9F|nr:uncharacterized protein LOC119666786 [Teleopsis dalmanni]
MFLKTGNAFLNILRKRSTTVNAFKKLIDIHPQVQYSLDKCKPIVALESTIITHGMPFPQNFDTALEVEELVRANGAVPATIAIIDGRIKVGLNNTDLAKLAAKKQNEVIKCSRRDLPFVISQQKCGGTTVAATMIIAHMTGIKVFATGGVGGVHRDGHISMDISADLIELGRTPVAVICSGVKSILDIPRTLEYLETQGVCVAAYQNYGIFPDFYTRDSGCKAPYNLENPVEAANLIKCLYDLDLNSGILIGVPIPEKYSANKGQITLAIEEAYKKAEQQDVNGKQVTPFLLEAISKITEGKSLNANMALIKNNATVGAQIAVELCKDNIYKDIYLQTEKMHKAPLIIGASILDLSLTMNDEIPTVLNGATYQIQTKQSAGGVGRNLAEGIFKLHGEANFEEVTFPDHLINHKGIRPPGKKIETIANFPKSRVVHELRRFIAIINFYRRFIPKAAEIQGQLQNFIKGNKKQDKTVIGWTADTDNAFAEYKEALINATTIVHLIPDANLVLHVDASNVAVDAALNQINNGQLEPLGFYSKRLTNTQVKYSTYERELLAIYQSVKYFKHAIEGRRCTIFTDHKPITYAFRQKPEKASPHQLRHLDYIGQLTTDIMHIAGKNNLVADFLSRIKAVSNEDLVDLDQLAANQKTDIEAYGFLSNTNKSALQLKWIVIPNSSKEIACDVSSNRVRPFVTEQFRQRVFNSIHNLAHAGRRATIKQIAERFVLRSELNYVFRANE